MRDFAIAISIIVLYFTSSPLCFSQQASSNFFVGISNDTIKPGETVLVRISAILEPNSPKNVVVRFIPPQGAVQQHLLNLKADSLGFVSATVEYPKDIANATTAHSGNYTVLVQDMERRIVIQRASFEVVKSRDLLDLMSKIPGVLYPIIAAAIGAGLTFLYNLLSAKRERKGTLYQRKAEYYLAIRPNFHRVASDMYYEAKKLEELQNTNDNDSEEIETEYRVCFYYLTLFLREDLVILEKTGSYLLNDSRGETLLNAIRNNVIWKFRKALTPLGFDEARHILLQEQTFKDLQEELRTSYRVCPLYELFKTWIKNNKRSTEFNELIFDLRLYYKILMYEDHNLFKDWYHRKIIRDSGLKDLKELKNLITSEIKNDSRYGSLVKDDYP